MGGIYCPRCNDGYLQLIKETLEEDEPLNKCDYCGAVWKIYIEDETEEGGTLRLIRVEDSGY